MEVVHKITAIYWQTENQEILGVRYQCGQPNLLGSGTIK
jgi:hypothetical protein